VDRAQVADFLRSRRGKVTPDDVGLPSTGRRRTPGLRRQEVAILANMSIDYYIRLEQARGPRPSRQILNALARALLLTIDERRHLFHLVGETIGPCSKPNRDVPSGVRHLLTTLVDVPAYVVDAKFDLLACNAAAAALSADDPATRTGVNMIRSLFTSDGAEAFLNTEAGAAFARSQVADLRAAVARYPDDPSIAALAAELVAASRPFATWWAEHDVTSPRTMRRTLRHPEHGTIEVDCQVLLVPERDQRVILYVAEPGTPSAAALREIVSASVSS